MPAPSASTTLAAAVLDRTEEFGDALAQDFPGLSQRDVLRILRTLKRRLLPARLRGRRRSARIDAAFRSWKSGTRGLKLYLRYIPRYQKLDHWERRGRARALDQAIRARRRREEKNIGVQNKR